MTSVRTKVPGTSIKFSRPNKKRLANTLAELLEQAVEDATSLEDTPGFKLDMSEWCFIPKYSESTTCTVCLGGSSMVRRLAQFETSELSFDDNQKMSAIDYMRTGSFMIALEQIQRTSSYEGPEGLECDCSCLSYMHAKDILCEKLEKLTKTFRAIRFGREKKLYDSHKRLSWGSYLSLAAILRELGL